MCLIEIITLSSREYIAHITRMQVKTPGELFSSATNNTDIQSIVQTLQHLKSHIGEILT